jgi:hypothetical protein
MNTDVLHHLKLTLRKVTLPHGPTEPADLPIFADGY